VDTVAPSEQLISRLSGRLHAALNGTSIEGHHMY